MVAGFLTLLCLASSAFAFSFAVFGDNHRNDELLDLIIDRLNKDPEIAFTVNLGDFVLNGKKEEYLAFNQKVKRLKKPLFNVLGNHDGVNGGWRIFQRTYGPLYYAFDHDDCRFIILNNAFKESFDAVQFAWLKKELAAARNKKIFVFMHKPLFDPSEIYQHYVMSGRAVTEELMKLFEKYRVRYVFAGHVHGYARSERKGVVYVVSAGAGAPLYLPRELGGFYNYVKITVKGDSIADQVIRPYE
ncbi:MAG: metallophosphoesterase [Candidatus Margulisbacteria bacterium]|nr:metallophosphoesterase [Candidatus Margulisiibacteriota bacterium]MBU1867053.1 metallophosphoesterase [Candidatus Margulisiibacteriota bacterium]